MFRIPFIRRNNTERESINDIIKRIQNGDEILKEKFINDYRPFIIKTISNTLGKYIDIYNSEEYSIGLAAFNESIECFNENRECSFFTFAEQVIKRKIYTFLNSRKKQPKMVPFSYLEDLESNFENRFLAVESCTELHEVEIKDQYDLFEEKLSEFGISFDDLVLNRPKHKDSLRQAVNIAKLLSEDKDLYAKLISRKTIPMKDLLSKVKVNHKAIEHNRKFIISVCIILGGGFEDIKEHIREFVI